MDRLTDLLVAAGQGDAAAFEALVRASQGDVWRFCAGSVGPGAADDAAQETFVRVWRSARTFRAESSARTWMLTLARRTCADHLERVRRRPVPVDAVRDQPAGEAGERLTAYDVVLRLEPDRRAAFVLTQLVGLSYAETAAVCGCPIGTVRSRVARARDDLIGALADPPRSPSTSPG